MKTLKTKSIIIIFLIFLMFSVVGCKQMTSDNLNVQTARVGILLCDQIISTNNDINNIKFFLKYNTDFLNITTFQKKDSLKKEETYEQLSSNTKSISEISVLFRRVYRSYDLMNDKTYVADESRISANVSSLCDALKLISAEDSKKLDEIKTTVNARKFDEKRVIFDLNSVFFRIIDSRLKIEKNEIEVAISNYKKIIQTVPATSFDSKKIEKLITEPISNENLLFEVYKLQLTDQAIEKNNNIQTKIDDIIANFESLNAIHAEFLKKQSSAEFIESSLAKISQNYKTIQEQKR